MYCIPVIPFNRPHTAETELKYLQQALNNHKLCGDGPLTKDVHAMLESTTGAQTALLTHSCTAALEMGALLVDAKPGDEVIMPSFTFVSTANAFALRGLVPVFVDIRSDTLNMDEALLEQALSTKTRAIAPVHYAGVFCEMDSINAVANHKRILVVEDAAQAFDSTYKGKKVGQLSKISCLSFHETKNVIAGEGGALLINDPLLAERAEILREKGTNRRQFLRGQVDKYSWVDLGSSFLPSELNAAVLKAQLERKDWILNERMRVWNQYHEALKDLETSGKLRRPIVPEGLTHNAHMYYILLPTSEARDFVLKDLAENGIQTTFHYVPLHETAPAKKFGRVAGTMTNTVGLSSRLLRLPLWIGVDQHFNEIIEKLKTSLKKI